MSTFFRSIFAFNSSNFFLPPVFTYNSHSLQFNESCQA